MSERILVATRGTSSAEGALRFARALAERDGAVVEVISVVTPAAVGPALPFDAGAYWSPQAAQLRIDVQRDAVRTQLEEVGGPAAGWPVRVEVGPTVPALVARATAHGAAMIVAGAGRRGRVERLLGGETTVRLMHAASVPVLSVPHDVPALPGVAVVGTDFSAFSWDATVAAARLVGPDGRLHLVHVMWPPLAEEGRPNEEEWIRTYRAGAEHRLRAVVNGLAAELPVHVETHLASGEPGTELLALQDRTGAGLVAVGSHGLGFFGRIALGSVSARVLRNAPCPVLVAPPRTPARELEADAVHEAAPSPALERLGDVE
jgi:nucleotide-binding universal stress UspA family protein